MSNNVPKVSAETRQQYLQDIAEKVQKKVERNSKKFDWADRLEQAARLGAEKGADEELDEKEVKTKKKKKKDKDKEKRKKAKKRHRSESPDIEKHLKREKKKAAKD